ncbi:hypothetical protein ONZ45_g4899 [Pleurotus djamor]|nr:hypothetical protein ONZ45_g4899 [Pleurotus djamor]
MYNTHPDYSSDVEQRQHHLGKMNGFGQGPNGQFKSSGYPYSNSSRQRHPQSNNVLPQSTSLRDNQNAFYPNEVFSPQLTSPTQPHIQAYEPRASYDFAGPQPNAVGSSHKSFGLDSFTAGGANPNAFAHQSGSKALSHNQLANGYPIPSNVYGAVQISSQTPFGPHVPTTVSSSSINGSAVGASHPLGPSNGANYIGAATARNDGTQEEISTIFVVGFPDDMQEPTLKIPNSNKDHNFGAGFNGRGGPGYPNGYMGPNDPYNMITVHQGGVIVDNGRDGMLSSWPSNNAPDDGLSASQLMGQNGLSLPRKQIIGFAKFKTRLEALAARDGLQGKRVDLEKGAVLKAEMARKNLHTKRGVGPVPGLVGNGLDMGSGSLTSVASYPQGLMNGLVSSDSLGYGGVELTSRDRSLGALEAVSQTFNGRWREQLVDPHGQGRRDDEERRKAGILNAMGLSSRGVRERLDDEEGQRRSKLRARDTVAFDAFHSVPAMSRQTSQSINGTNGVLNDRDLPNGAATANGYSFPGLGAHYVEEGLGPWDQVVKTAPLPISSSQRSSSPHLTSSSFNSNPDPVRSFSPSIGNRDANHQHSQSQSSSSSMVGPTQVMPSHRPGAVGEPVPATIDTDMAQSMGTLAVSTNNGNTSPQLPSPASGSSSGGSGRNGVDRNPPINTLYVGNLPNTPPPGLPQDSLEDKLRDLFKSQAGFRKMCFSQKSNGPMCFVEFEDVTLASRALHELYGHTLNGLVKGGIRLSYSKNPLGVRTPTSAGSSGPSMQQQQLQGTAAQQAVDSLPSRFDEQVRPTILRRDTNPPPPQTTYMTSPPPRFVSPTPSGVNYGASNSIPHLLSRGSQPNLQSYASTFSPFGLSSPPFDSPGPDHNAH